jgi:hypothetical protein
MGVCILGMGDCTSKNSVDITNITNNNTEINNSIKTNIEQNCMSAISQLNTINIVGSKVKKLSASQKNSMESLCILQTILKSTTNADVVNNLMNQVSKNLKSEGGLLGSPAENSSVVKSITSNSTKIDNSKFNNVAKNCISDTKQSNLLNIIGSDVEDTTTDQANAAFLKCMSTHSDDTGIDASVLADTKIKADVTASAVSGDIGRSVGNAAEGMGKGVGAAIQAFMIPIAIICVILLSLSLIGAYFMMKNPEATQQLAGTASQMYQQYKQ